MNRIQLIRARVLKTAQKETATGTGTMRIPGMKIGTQMNPGGPNFEDVVFLCDELEKIGEFLKTAEFTNQADSHIAQKFIHEINQKAG